ncbi:Adaptor protein complex 2 subunit alpha (AP2A1) [Carpediemonas membranifera]|uniref:AP-2 complex subunit alpha n=1 Tax=Carpediemonas membranifera TaxID=201153 RepID=A0A8J6AS81_9EUKA|nr:Adaptor protein complex 2 subunit alpha (AP2A1) [Carpediemonas membranifera]|eukprot:KAG9393121.1 Adaptor protein complex 2 subunit alpha (AP2A1) [Carpediemonas membranifera]
MRGLRHYISDIRDSKTTEAEKARVMKELAHIRKKFSREQESKLTKYDRRKYVAKLIYTYVLGYDIDFGVYQAVNLLASNDLEEKIIGYMYAGIIIDENNEQSMLITNTVLSDLQSSGQQCALALNCLSNIGGQSMAEAVAPVVQQQLLAPASTVRTILRKKASLCLLRMYRSCPDVLDLATIAKSMPNLLEVRNVGFLTSLLSLLQEMSSRQPELFVPTASRVVHLLVKIVIKKEVAGEHVYYGIPCPWLLVKLMRYLSSIPLTEEDDYWRDTVAVIDRVLATTDPARNSNRTNIMYAVFNDAVRLAIHIGHPNLFDAATNVNSILEKALESTDANLRYCGLRVLLNLSAAPRYIPGITQHVEPVLKALGDADVEVARRAVDVAFSLCTQETVDTFIEALMRHLDHPVLRPVLVPRIAVLAENFMPNTEWFVDINIRLLKEAGDDAPIAVWHRLAYLITNNPASQSYALQSVLAATSTAFHTPIAKAAAFIIGEFGMHGDADTCAARLLEIASTCHDALAVCITAAGKLIVRGGLSDSSERRLRGLGADQTDSLILDIQQRAVEQAALLQAGELFSDIFIPLPAFPERESALVDQINGAKREAHEEESDDEVSDDEESHEAMLIDTGAPSAGPEDVLSPGAVLADLIGLSDKPAEAAAPQGPKLEFVGTKLVGVIRPENGKTLAVMASFSRTQEAASLDLALKNVGTGPLSDFQIQFNRNFFGLRPVAMDLLPGVTLGPGDVRRASVPFSSAIPSADVPADRLQVAIKCSEGLSFFSTGLPALMLTDIAPAAPAIDEFIAQWKALPTISTASSPMTDPAAVNAKLETQGMTLFGHRSAGGRADMFAEPVVSRMDGPVKAFVHVSVADSTAVEVRSKDEGFAKMVAEDFGRVLEL